MNERQRKVKMARKSCQVKTSPWSFDLKINIYSIIKDFVATVCVLDISNDKVFFFITMMAIVPQCAPTLVKCHLWSMTLLVWLCDFGSSSKLLFLVMILVLENAMQFKRNITKKQLSSNRTDELLRKSNL